MKVTENWWFVAIHCKAAIGRTKLNRRMIEVPTRAPSLKKCTMLEKVLRLDCKREANMNVHLRKFVTGLLLVVAWPLPYAWSQDANRPEPAPSSRADFPAESQAGPDSPYKLRVDATLVSVDLVVTDDQGNILGGLKGGNFRLLDDGKPQQILGFSPTADPITVVLLLEYSSASYSYYAAKATEWGSVFLNHLEPQDWVAMVTFDIKSKVQVDFTRNRYEVRDALNTMGFPQFREANLFDALIDTLDKLDKVRSRTSVLLLSTGANSFSASTFDDVLARLRKTDATIFCIGLAESEYMHSYGSNITYLQSKNMLNEFAKRTGGFALFPRFEGELPDIFRLVTGYLRNQYTLTYRLPKEQRDGRHHRIKVELIGPDGKPLTFTDEKGKKRKLVVHAREGYTAPKSSGEQLLKPADEEVGID